MKKTIEIRCAHDELVSVAALKENPKNPRTIKPNKLAQLKKQIIEHGLFKPTIVGEDNLIIGGNMRHRALSELEKEGYEVKVPVSVFRGTDEQKRQIVLLDNNDSGEWETSELSEYIDDLKIDIPDFDIEMAGFDDAMLEDMNFEPIEPRDVDEDELGEKQCEPVLIEFICGDIIGGIPQELYDLFLYRWKKIKKRLGEDDTVAKVFEAFLDENK